MYHTGTRRCYDCQMEVADLKAHRSECSNPRRLRGGGVIRRLAHPVRPAGEARAGALPGRDVFFVLDVSGSMEGRRLDEAKRAIAEVHAEVLQDDDRMALITFDSKAFFKLKPRANGQLARKGELPTLLARIFAKGSTALYDAVWLALEQIVDVTRPTQLLVLTDGEDNASTHTLAQVVERAKAFPALSLDIRYVGSPLGDTAARAFAQLVEGRGTVQVITVETIVTSIRTTVEQVASA